MSNRVDTVQLRKIGKRAPWVARQDDEGPLVLAAADEVDRLERIERLVLRRAAGGYTVISITDLQMALYGTQKPAEPKLTHQDVDLAWARYITDTRGLRGSSVPEAQAWDRYMDVLKKWRAQQ